MHIKAQTQALCLGWILGLSASSAWAVEQMSTTEIISATTSANFSSCWRWQVKGLCFWLKCIGPKCSIRTSTQVEHYLPDLTVAVMTRTGNSDGDSHPWTEQNSFNSTYASLGNALAQGGGMTSAGTQRATVAGQQRKLHFFEADVIGNPAVSIMGSMSGSYTCGSEVTGFWPYYVSRTDAAEWRHRILQQWLFPVLSLEMSAGTLGSVLWVGHDTGNPLTSQPWGYLQPISGFIAQEQEHKAAAVVMHRVAHLVTRDDRPFGAHLYQTVNGSDKEGYWSAEEFEPQNEISGLVQALSPKTESQCSALPNGPDASLTTAYPIAKAGHYLWNVWRPYTCCERKGQKFIRATYTPPY